MFVHRLLLAVLFLWADGNPVPPLCHQESTVEDRDCSGRFITTAIPIKVTSKPSVSVPVPLLADEPAYETPGGESTGQTYQTEEVVAGEVGPDGDGTGPGRVATAVWNNKGQGSGPTRTGEETSSQKRDTETDTLIGGLPKQEEKDGEKTALSWMTKSPTLDNSTDSLRGGENGSRLRLPILRPSILEQDTEMTGSTSSEQVTYTGLDHRGATLTGSLFSPMSSPHSSLSSIAESLLAPQEDATVPAFSDPLLPELGPGPTSRQEGLESLWTEPLKQSGEHTVIPSSQDMPTEGTMSSEDLPLIFEPFDDVTSVGALAGSSLTSQPAVMATKRTMLSVTSDQLVTVDTEENGGPSHAPSLLLPDWTSPWQTSGAEISEPISPSGPAPSETEQPDESIDTVGGETIRGLGGTQPMSGPSPFQNSIVTVTMATDQPPPKLRLGLEEVESEDEPEEDEEDEYTTESEEESDEHQTEASLTAPTRPPYSLIPPPPVWVQHNQGLMRGWVELLREKAGYVSGMLAPVGIGIAGALLIVGVLYSIRVIHRKRRNSFKHERRKVRQTEQPGEPGSNRQDQAMLLADSSEDEF